MNNNHIPVMLNEIKSFIPKNKKLNLIDATFGGGGYSKAILNNFEVMNLIAIDRDPVSRIFFDEIKKNFKNLELFNEKFSKIDELVNKSNFSNYKFDILIFDLGLSSNQIDNPERGFSFQKMGRLDMKMGSSEINAFEVINSFDEKKLADISEINQISYLELTHYMTNMLLRDTDMMGMAQGLEIRAPLLDHKLVELMLQVPSNLKIKSYKQKPLLLEALSEKLPDEAVFRKKMGFTIPLQLWMKNQLKREIETTLLKPMAQLEEFLDEKSIEEIWRDFLTNKVSWSRPWALYVLKSWISKNILS